MGESNNNINQQCLQVQAIANPKRNYKNPQDLNSASLVHHVMARDLLASPRAYRESGRRGLTFGTVTTPSAN